MPEPAQVITTDAEIDAALERARAYEKVAQRVVRAFYSNATASFRLVFDNGVTYTIPRHLLQGLGEAGEEELKQIQILGDGTGLLWPLLDVAHYVPKMLQGVYGTEKWMTSLYHQRNRPGLVEGSDPRPMKAENKSSSGLAGKGKPAPQNGRQDDREGGRIEEKSGSTLVASLRKIYGDDFLPAWPSDAKLSAVRGETDMSLIELVRQHRRGKT
jgi:hypothetical protein